MPGFSHARYCYSSSFPDESASAFVFACGFVAAAFPGGGFACAFADCASVEDFLLGGAFPTVKYFRIFSILFGPIPLIASRSSTLLNAPFDFLICRILSAVEGPIPGTNCSSALVAVFKFTGCAGGFFLARTALAQHTSRKKENKEDARR
jgi:hypothetical protein